MINVDSTVHEHPPGLVTSVVTLASVLVLLVLLFEYTNIFTSWLSWVFMPSVVGLLVYEFWLRAGGKIRDD